MATGEAAVSPDEASRLLDATTTVVTAVTPSAAREDDGFRTPKRKWIALAMFCGLAFAQNTIFVEWNSVANSAKEAFRPSWTDGTFAWQVNLATVTSPVTQYPIWWSIQKFGLSSTLRWGAVFPLFVSTALSVIPLAFSSVGGDEFKAFTYVAYTLTGITGAVFFSSITKFSTLWFPPDQRATATGLSITFANMGSLLPALVGPWMVSVGLDDQATVRTELFHYLLIYFVIAGLLFMGFLLCLPIEAARSHPNQLETGPRLGDARVVLINVRALLRNPMVLYTMTLYSFSTLPIIWGLNMLNVTMATLGISQKSIGVLIVASTIASFVTTVLVSRAADLFFRFRLKTLILVILSLHAASMIGLGVTALGAGNSSSHPNQFVIFVVYSITIALLHSCAPLIYELVAEMSHPVPEDIVSGLTNQFNNLFGVVFYLVFSEMSDGVNNDYSWLFYTLMIVPVLVTVLFFGVKEHYGRPTTIIEVQPSQNDS